MAGSDEFFSISSQRSLASISLSKALKVTSKSHSCLSMHLEIIKRRFVGRVFYQKGVITTSHMIHSPPLKPEELERELELDHKAPLDVSSYCQMLLLLS